MIYALGFVSNVYIFYAYGGKALVDFYHEMQMVNNNLLWKAIIAVIFALVLFLLQINKYTAGFLTLIITVLIAAVSLFIGIDSIVVLVFSRLEYSALDLSSLNRYIERGTIKYQYSTLTYDLGLAGYILFLLTSIFTSFFVIRNALKRKNK